MFVSGSDFVKRIVPLVLTFGVGIIIVFDFFVSIKEVSAGVVQMQNWSIPMTSILVVYSFFVFLMFHARQVMKRTKGVWFFSIWSIIVAISYIVLGMTIGIDNKTYQFLYVNFNTSVSTALGALYILMIYSAFYRVLTIRNIEAAVFFICAILVLMSNTPLITYYFPWTLTAGTWIMSVLNTAGMRGLTITAAIGALALSLRLLIGKGGKVTSGEGGGG